MKKEDVSVNRRLTPRVACQLVVRYRTEGAVHPATAVDVSNQGCRLRVGQSLARGIHVTVLLQRKPGAVPPAEVLVPGTVVWCRSEGLSYQVGVAFRSEPSGLQEILETV